MRRRLVGSKSVYDIQVIPYRRLLPRNLKRLSNRELIGLINDTYNHPNTYPQADHIAIVKSTDIDVKIPNNTSGYLYTGRDKVLGPLYEALDSRGLAASRAEHRKTAERHFRREELNEAKIKAFILHPDELDVIGVDSEDGPRRKKREVLYHHMNKRALKKILKTKKLQAGKNIENVRVKGAGLSDTYLRNVLCINYDKDWFYNHPEFAQRVVSSGKGVAWDVDTKDLASRAIQYSGEKEEVTREPTRLDRVVIIVSDPALLRDLKKRGLKVVDGRKGAPMVEKEVKSLFRKK
ncbi:MAG: hypothetical protein ACTSU5_06285 [Promethearchaeota archaeon]